MLITIIQPCAENDVVSREQHAGTVNLEVDFQTPFQSPCTLSLRPLPILQTRKGGPRTAEEAAQAGALRNAVQTDPALWRTNIVRQVVFNLAQKKICCTLVDDTFYQFPLNNRCALHLGTVARSFEKARKTLDEMARASSPELAPSPQPPERRVIRRKSSILDTLASTLPFLGLSGGNDKYGDSSPLTPEKDVATECAPIELRTLGGRTGSPSSSAGPTYKLTAANATLARARSEIMDLFRRHVLHAHLSDLLPETYAKWFACSNLRKAEHKMVLFNDALDSRMRKLEQCENALRTMRNAFAQHLDAPAATEGTPHQGDPPCLRAATANSPESNALGRPFSVTMKTSDDEEDIGTRGKKRLRLHSSANGTTSPIAGHISESRAVVPSNAGESAEWERLIQDLLSYLQQPELPVPFIKAILQDIKSEIIHTATRYRLELLPRRFSGEKSGPMTNNENRPPSLVHLDNATSAPDADVPTRSGFDLGRRFVPVAAPAAEPANGGLPGRLTTLCRARDALEEKLDNLAEGVSNNPSTKALEGNSLDPAILSRLASAFMSLAGVTDLEVNDQDAYDAPVPTDFARLYIALKAVSARHANRKYTLVREKLQAAMEKEKWRAEIFRIDTEAGERRQKEQDLVNEKRKRVSAAMRAMPMMRRASLPSLKQQKEKQEKLDQEQRAQEAQVQEVEVRQIIVSERNDETGSDRGSVDIVRESLEVGGNTDEAVRGSIEVRATIKVSPRTEDNTRCGSRVLMASSDIPRGRTEVAGGALDNPRNSAEGARRSMDVIRTPEDGNLVGLIGFPMKCEKEPIAATKAELESSPGTKANRRNREGSGGSVSDLEDHYSEKKDKRMQIGKASRGATKGPSTRAASVIETGMKRRGSTGSLDLILCGGTQDEDESVVEWPGEDRTHVAGVLFKSSRGSHKSGASDGRKSESRGQVEKSKVVEKDNQQSQQVLGEVEREGKECANVQEHATQSQIGCKALKRAVIRGSPQKPHVRSRRTSLPSGPSRPAPVAMSLHSRPHIVPARGGHYNRASAAHGVSVTEFFPKVKASGNGWILGQMDTNNTCSGS